MKKEASLVKDAVCEAYVKYGMKVFEYETAEKQRSQEEQADEVTVGQAEGGSRKKSRLSSGGAADDEYGFSDDEVEEVALQVDSVEEDLEEARVVRAAELRKEAAVAFSEYRNYSRIQLTAERGWDQYLPENPAAEGPVIATPAPASAVAVAAGEAGQSTGAGFFAPRPATVAARPVRAAVPSAQVGLNDAAAPQYDLMADLLHSDMFTLLSDVRRSETLRIQQGKPAKFGYLPMMAVATLGALNAESFCERVLSCVKLVVSDLHVSLKPQEIHMFVILRMNLDFMEYMRASYPDTPLSEFRAVDTYVREHGGLEALEDDEDDE